MQRHGKNEYVVSILPPSDTDAASTVVDAALGELLTTCSKMEWLIKHGEAALRPESRHGNTLLFYKKSQVHYEPLGLVAAIVSWNYRTRFVFDCVLELTVYFQRSTICYLRLWLPFFPAIQSS